MPAAAACAAGARAGGRTMHITSSDVRRPGPGAEGRLCPQEDRGCDYGADRACRTFWCRSVSAMQVRELLYTPSTAYCWLHDMGTHADNSSGAVLMYGRVGQGRLMPGAFLPMCKCGDAPLVQRQ